MNGRIVRFLVITALTVALIEGRTFAAQRNNSDFDNIGTRNINQGTPNFVWLEKEIGIGRRLAAKVSGPRRSSPIQQSPSTSIGLDRPLSGTPTRRSSNSLSGSSTQKN